MWVLPKLNTWAMSTCVDVEIKPELIISLLLWVSEKETW